MAPVDVDGEVAGSKTGERANHAALILIDRRSGADRFAHGESDEFANAQRCRQRKGNRTVGGDGMEIERHADANHTASFGAVSRSRLPVRSTVETMSLEKYVAKMEDAHIAVLLRDGIDDMPQRARAALAASIFDAFRDRGESSDDAAEGANVALEQIEQGECQAVAALVTYASENTGLLKEAIALFEEEHATEIGSLPATLRNVAHGDG